MSTPAVSAVIRKRKARINHHVYVFPLCALIGNSY